VDPERWDDSLAVRRRFRKAGGLRAAELAATARAKVEKISPLKTVQTVLALVRERLGVLTPGDGHDGSACGIPIAIPRGECFVTLPHRVRDGR